MAFPGKDRPDPDDQDNDNDDSNNTMNVVRLYDQKYTQMMQDVYKQVDLEHIGGDDEAQDELGYLGRSKHYRDNRKLTPITFEEII